MEVQDERVPKVGSYTVGLKEREQFRSDERLAAVKGILGEIKFWGRRYFVSTVVSDENVIRAYIRHQEEDVD